MIGQAMVTYEWSDWRNGDLWWTQSVYRSSRTTADRGFLPNCINTSKPWPVKVQRIRGLRLYVEEENAAGQAVYKKLGMSYAGYHVYEREF